MSWRWTRSSTTACLTWSTCSRRLQRHEPTAAFTSPMRRAPLHWPRCTPSARSFRAATARPRIVPHATPALYKRDSPMTTAQRLGAGAQCPRVQRLLHLACAGAEAAHEEVNQAIVKGWQALGPRFLPFADAATKELPLGRLLRLSLFQVSVGMAMVLLTGTLNRVMIVELGVPAWLVGLMVSLPHRLRALPRADRLQVRHAPLGAGLAARALYLVRHHDAVRRLRHPALRPAGADRATAMAPPCRARSVPHWPSCWWVPASTRRRRRASRWPMTSRRPKHAAAGRGPALCHAAGSA